MASEIKFSSLNCRGLHSADKRKDVFDYLKVRGSHIYCLQDVHWDSNMIATISTEWGGNCFIAPGTNNSRGVAILFNDNFNVTVTRIHCNSNGNLIAVAFQTCQYEVTLVVLYGPNTDTPAFFNEVQNIIEDFNTPHCIVVGDWNVVLDTDMDSLNYLHTNNPKSRQVVHKLMKNLDLFDVWRVFHPITKRFTWRQKNPLKQSRLDYFLVSSGLLNTVTTATITPGYRSDHFMINSSFRLGQMVTGKGFWKFNNSLLEDEAYQKIVKNVIDETITEYACLPYNIDKLLSIPRNMVDFNINDQLFFETLLMNIRGKTISYSSFKKKSEIKREVYLLNEIDRVHSIYSDNIYLREYCDSLEKELQHLREKKLKGSFIRSRVEWVDEGEKPSKFFLNLEKRNHVSKLICHLTNDDNEQIFDQDGIQEETYNFYKKLYSSNDSHLSDLNQCDGYWNCLNRLFS
ncbi:hypothetical protein HOLleu_31834 [Holothuria leucospilota]|uniref:exodeoxyribonuclease III n=1 Tax=Holothuria leucospilota TaxID=206669 RepID=A0A9Q0YQS3_HOLLE|nr:hypothetical protein HOLleu_31834 [Holothuria leucospilota]